MLSMVARIASITIQLMWFDARLHPINTDRIYSCVQSRLLSRQNSAGIAWILILPWFWIYKSSWIINGSWGYMDNKPKKTHTLGWRTKAVMNWLDVAGISLTESSAGMLVGNGRRRAVTCYPDANQQSRCIGVWLLQRRRASSGWTIRHQRWGRW